MGRQRGSETDCPPRTPLNAVATDDAVGQAIDALSSSRGRTHAFTRWNFTLNVMGMGTALPSFNAGENRALRT